MLIWEAMRNFTKQQPMNFPKTMDHEKNFSKNRKKFQLLNWKLSSQKIYCAEKWKSKNKSDFWIRKGELKDETE